MRTVITGASGLLGGNLAIELVKQGHAVRATRRGSSKVAHLDAFPIEWVEADLDQPERLARAFEGADAVFHCAALVSIRKTATPALVQANVQGTRNVIAAIQQAGAGRLLHCSTVGAIGLSEDGQPCTEAARWNFDEQGMADGYVTTKHQAQQVIEEAVRSGLDAVIANPTYMLGPYDAKPSSGKMIIEVIQRKVPGWTPGANNFVDVRDVARGMILALERGRAGERYILGGQNMSYKDAFELIASVAGVAPPRRRVPRPLARLIGWAGDVQELLSRDEPLINSVTVRYGFCSTFQFSSEKARAELGYAPGPLEPAIADAIAWFKASGML